ncbi:HdeD family acid-resistance protein [Arhodomonas sp. AD133]|uniref:HdeD family acid-resistance protein n=1 Tax=Arhodomonas sp. AD133 TaxID=3415009 RepID=UPI003EBB3807
MRLRRATRGARFVERLFGPLEESWGWLLLLGALMVVLGTIGLGMTFFMTLASVLAFGFLLVIGAGARFAQAVTARGRSGVVLAVGTGVLYAVAGSVVIGDPVVASEWLTLVLAAVIIGVGGLRVISALEHRDSPGWGVTLVGGLAAVALGAMVVLEWPLSGLWVIGFFIAVEMLLNGWTCIVLALLVRRATA